MQLFTECDATAFIPEYETIAKRVLEGGLYFFECPFETEISLYIVEPEAIRALNAAQRGIDKVTDVLSFPNLDFEKEADFSSIPEGDADCFDPESGDLCLGEIVICAEKVYEQAEEYGHSDLREYAFLLTHSLLHLLGFDHENDEERKRMEELQEKILQKLGIVRE